MGLLDQIGDLVDKGGGTDKLMGAAMDLVGGKDGLQDLVSKFDKAGIGNIAQSWLDKGDNKAVSADQVREALSDEQLQKAADEAGVDKDQAAEGLAGMLPGLIDKLTPDGQIPDLGDLKDIAGKFLGR